MSGEPRIKQYRPDWDVLDRRELPTASLTASLSGGVLAVWGTSASAPIVIDVHASPSRKGVAGWVVVEGVGSFKASQVHQVIVGSVSGENLVIHRARKWNPSIQVLTPVAPPSADPAPISQPILPPAPLPPPILNLPPNATLSPSEEAIVTLVNQFRQQNGLSPLTENIKLIQTAQIHAKDMANMNIMAHDLPGAALPGLVDRARYFGYQYSSMGENIAYNYPDASSVMNGWMNSPGHRANMLDAGFTQIGVGIALDAQGSPYYCQVFGCPA